MSMYGIQRPMTAEEMKKNMESMKAALSGGQSFPNQTLPVGSVGTSQITNQGIGVAECPGANEMLNQLHGEISGLFVTLGLLSDRLGTVLVDPTNPVESVSQNPEMGTVMQTQISAMICTVSDLNTRMLTLLGRIRL